MLWEDRYGTRRIEEIIPVTGSAVDVVWFRTGSFGSENVAIFCTVRSTWDSFEVDLTGENEPSIGEVPFVELFPKSVLPLRTEELDPVFDLDPERSEDTVPSCVAAFQIPCFDCPRDNPE